MCNEVVISLKYISFVFFSSESSRFFKFLQIILASEIVSSYAMNFKEKSNLLLSVLMSVFFFQFKVFIRVQPRPRKETVEVF